MKLQSLSNPQARSSEVAITLKLRSAGGSWPEMTSPNVYCFCVVCASWSLLLFICSFVHLFGLLWLLSLLFCFLLCLCVRPFLTSLRPFFIAVSSSVCLQFLLFCAVLSQGSFLFVHCSLQALLFLCTLFPLRSQHVLFEQFHLSDCSCVMLDQRRKAKEIKNVCVEDEVIFLSSFSIIETFTFSFVLILFFCSGFSLVAVCQAAMTFW